MIVLVVKTESSEGNGHLQLWFLAPQRDRLLVKERGLFVQRMRRHVPLMLGSPLENLRAGFGTPVLRLILNFRVLNAMVATWQRNWFQKKWDEW